MDTVLVNNNNLPKMKIKYTTLLALLAICFSQYSCTKQKVDHSLLMNCPFVQDDHSEDGYIDDNERALMDQCSANQLTSADDIRNNLLGEWQLIGHGEGWIPTVSQPCASLLITATEITFNYGDKHIDIQSTHLWELQTTIVNTPPPNLRHRITTTPDLEVRLGITTFCDNYMYGNSTPSDGNMYLFEKVR